jgi:C4-dicarboxylate-specific signal transduction histidine kinase
VSEQSHPVVFRPRARLVSVLGEHLISDSAVGLIELVKNAYDADATEVKVELRNPKDPESGSIVVIDNGCGMTLDDIESKWLSPAVDHKERGKKRGERSERGRLPIGEKGVGRFAVHHLGHRLRLTTRSQGQNEIVLEIDWDRFEGSDSFLDGVTLEAIEREPEIFRDAATGTRLEITGLRAGWSDALLRKVHRTLRRLQSPLREEALDFRIWLLSPQFPELQDIDPTDILDRAHYEFRAVIQSDGECDYEYICRHPAMTPRWRPGTESLLPLGASDFKERPPESGPFWLNLYVWDRSSNFLQASGVSRHELDAHCGVSLFRDSLRVLPYGEPGDDWLYLDQERIQAPADRIGNNQVIGLVLVDQATNLQLRDKTNREGLIETQAFQDLRTLVRAAIRLFTTHWRRDRPATAAKRSSTHRGDIDGARALASAIGETARDDVPVRRPASGHDVSDEPAGSGQPAATDMITQRQAVHELLSELDDVSANLREQNRQRDIMRQLAATGLAAERVVHEFGRQVAAAMHHLERHEVIARDTAAHESLAAVTACLRTLRNEFRVLAPYESAGRADRLRRTSIADAVDLALLLNQKGLDSAGVKPSIEGNDFTARSRPAAVAQVLDNLIHNATYWVARGSEGDRRIGVLLRPERRQVVVADSGPGVHPEIVEQLFQPFTSLKVEGTGLGLFVSAQLADSLRCTLRLADDEERPDQFGGAIFILEFPPAENDKEHM